MRLLQEDDKSFLPGCQLANNADLALRESFNVQLEDIGQKGPTADIWRAASRLLPGPRVYPFTTPLFSRFIHLWHVQIFIRS